MIFHIYRNIKSIMQYLNASNFLSRGHWIGENLEPGSRNDVNQLFKKYIFIGVEKNYSIKTKIVYLEYKISLNLKCV